MTTGLERALELVKVQASIDLLQSLIRIRSTNPPAEEITLARWVHERLQQSGLVSELLPFDGKRANVIARVKGSGEQPALIFSAHFDTVPEGEMPWDYPPYGGELNNGRIYGRGAADMKGGMAAMILAAEVLAAASVRLRGDLILAFTSGETSNCIGARKLMEASKLDGAGAFLVSEPTSLNVGIAEKAALWLRLSARGRTSHGSQPHAGSNAIRKLVDALARLSNFEFGALSHPLLGAPTIAIGKIHGGVNINVTPDFCVAELDIRLLPQQDPAGIIKKLQQHLGSDIHIEQIDFKPAVETPESDPFVRDCIEACAAEVRNIIPPIGLSYFTDAAVLCHELSLPMVILGPGATEMTHQHNEYCEVDFLVKAARIFVRIAHRYLGEAH